MLVLRERSGNPRGFSLYESLFLERRKIYASTHAVSRITSPKSRVGRDLGLRAGYNLDSSHGEKLEG
jgi:hypothetical protein